MDTEKKQLELEENILGTTLIKEFLTQKMNNQIDHLNVLASNRRDERKLIIKEAVEKIKNQVNNIESIENTTKIKDIRSSIQGYEGTASRVYFKCYQSL